MVDALSPGSCSKKGIKCCLSWQRFNAEFVELLTPNNPAAVALGAFIRRIYHGLRPLTDLQAGQIKPISRCLQLNVGWANDSITHADAWLRTLNQVSQVRSLIAPNTFQPQSFIHPQSTDDFQLARSLTTVASSFRQFIAKSDPSPNIDQAFCYQLVYHI